MTRARLVAVFLAVLAGGLIVAGVSVMYWPAGLITAGTLILVGLFGPDVDGDA